MKRLIKINIIVLLVLTTFLTAYAKRELKDDEVSNILVPRMTKAPVIDGKIDEIEWKEAAAISGVAGWVDNNLLPRPSTFYFAWDPDHFYMACRVYLKPGYKPNTWNGRSEGMAFVFDDGLELVFKPKGKNLVFDCAGAAYRLFINNLGFKGDMTRLELGQQLKNWAPEFKVATRITEPGSAPNGGSWWELEMSSVPEDFNLKGKHQAGDEWRLMLGVNHFGAGFSQARIPCLGSYFESDGQGYTKAILVDNMPVVKFTMNDLENLTITNKASMGFSVFNQAKKSEKVDIAINIGDSLITNLTLNVPANNEAKIDFKKEIPHDLTNGILRVLATAEGKELLKYVVFFERGALAEIILPQPERDKTKFPFSAKFNPVRGLLLISGDTYYLATNQVPLSMHYVVKSDKGDKLAENTLTNITEWYFREMISLPSVPPGTCTVAGVMTLADGTTLGPMTNYFEKIDEAKAFPHWWNRKDIGSVERVLPPFTAIKRVKGESTTYECWGRKYSLNAMGLPSGLISQSNPVLAAPARIVVVLDGKEHVVEMPTPKITEEKDWRVNFEGKAEGAGLEFTAKGWMEQDGLVYTEITYKPKGNVPIKVDALRVEFPLVDEEAESLLCIGPGNNFSSHTAMVIPKNKQGEIWSTLITGRAGSGMFIGSFYPTVWIGSERRGFLWWGDNDKGWFPDNEVPAHDLVRIPGKSFRQKQDVLVLRNNIIGKPVEINKAHTFAFGWNATPFKPLLQGWRNWAATEDGTFFAPFRGLRMDSKTGKKVKEGSGQKNWIHPESRYPEEWAELWACQKTNSRCMGYEGSDSHVNRLVPFDPYAARNGIFWGHMSFTLHGYGEKTLEQNLYRYFKDEWYFSSETWNESFIDYCIYLFDRAFREGGVVSTYWDITFPILHDNLLGGLGYELPDGRIQKSYGGFNIRRFFQRLHAAAYDNKLLPGCNGVHSTHAYVTVAMPWVEAVLDGERNWNIDLSENDWVDYYPTNRMRAFAVPHNWGVGICWMANLDGTNKTKKALARLGQGEYIRLHDSWINPYVETAKRMPDSVLEWGMNNIDVEYIPYWRNEAIKSGDDKILVSAWKIPSEKRILFEVFNYGYRENKDVNLKLNLKELGLTGKNLIVRDLYNAGCSNEPVSFDAKNATISIKQLPRHRGRLVGIAEVDDAAFKSLSAKLPQWAQQEIMDELIDYGMCRKETMVVEANNVKLISCTNENIKINMWQLPDRVVLFVSNTSEKPISSVELKADLQGLGITFKKWQTFVRTKLFGVTDEKNKRMLSPQLNYYDGIITLNKLPAKDGRIIGLRSY